MQFRLLNGNGNIVDDKNSNPIDSGCLRYEKNAGSKWNSSIASGVEATARNDIVHLEFGSNNSHNNTSPCLPVSMWQRLS